MSPNTDQLLQPVLLRYQDYNHNLPATLLYKPNSPTLFNMSAKLLLAALMFAPAIFGLAVPNGAAEVGIMARDSVAAPPPPPPPAGGPPAGNPGGPQPSGPSPVPPIGAPTPSPPGPGPQPTGPNPPPPAPTGGAPHPPTL